MTINKDAGGEDEILITPASGNLWPFLKELYSFRELLLFLVWKDIKIQFAQTILGFGWLVLRPLLNVLVLTLVFGKLARVPSDDAPYLLFALSGMLAWSYFSSSVGKAALSLVGNSALITKIYFPRIYVPLSVVLSGLIEFTATFVIYFLISAVFYHRLPTFALLSLPLPLLLLMMTTVGAALWLSALAVDFRDVRHASQYLLQMLMFAAPIIWPLSLLQERLGAGSEAFLGWYAFYPMVGVVEGFRHALLGTGTMPWEYLGPGFLTATVLISSGLYYFRRREQLMADVV